MQHICTFAGKQHGSGEAVWNSIVQEKYPETYEGEALAFVTISAHCFHPYILYHTFLELINLSLVLPTMHCGAESLPKIAEFSKWLTCGSKMVAWRLSTDEGVNFVIDILVYCDKQSCCPLNPVYSSEAKYCRLRILFPIQYPIKMYIIIYLLCSFGILFEVKYCNSKICENGFKKMLWVKWFSNLCNLNE